ncbi:hypothetical protein ACJ41O_006493 [Fusarium nematophilum]
MGLPNDETVDESPRLAGGAGTTGLTPDDIRAAVRQEILAMAGSSSAAAELQSVPPSYDASARLLDSDPAAAATDDPENGKSCNVPTNKLQMRPLWQRVALLVLIICLVFSPIVLMIALGETGHDPLRLGILSFFLVCAHTFGYLTVLSILPDQLLAYLTHGKKAFGGSESTKRNGEEDDDVPWAFYFLTYHWLGNFLLFWFVMWGFLVSGDDTLVPRFELAARFDGKITQHDALGTLTTCIYDRVPDVKRHATIDDFAFCLAEMGMPKTNS